MVMAPLFVMNVKSNSRRYVALMLAVALELIVTVWLPGVIQLPTGAKLTVCRPNARLYNVNPLLCQLPPSTCHCAPPAATASGSRVTCSDPPGIFHVWTGIPVACVKFVQPVVPGRA